MPQTLAQFVEGLRPLATGPLSFTWIEDYAWLKAYPLRQPSPGDTTGLTYAIPWVMAEGDELGHVRISNRKALAAGLTCRPLLDTARDTLAWRRSDAVPAPLRETPRYVLSPAQEEAMLAAWKVRKTPQIGPVSGAVAGSTGRDVPPGTTCLALHRPADFCRIAAVATGR